MLFQAACTIIVYHIHHMYHANNFLFILMTFRMVKYLISNLKLLDDL